MKMLLHSGDRHKPCLFGKILIVSMLILSMVFSPVLSTAQPPAGPNQAPGAPVGLLTNAMENPLNVEGAPRFSWWPQDADFDEVQTAYQIVVKDGLTGDTVWDSGKTTSPEQTQVVYSGPALTPAHPYSWTVATWDKEDAASPVSEPEKFSTGMTDADWNATWIRPSNAAGTNYAYGRNIFWYTRKETALADKPIQRALAYIACAHDYELNINGKRLGRGQSFDYPSETRYQGWDITSAISGDAALTIGLLARWYGNGQGRAGAGAGTGQSNNAQHGLLGKFVVYYADGTSQTVVTDGTWRMTDTPLGGTTARNGEGDFVETYDARKEIPGWNGAGFDDSAWRPVFVRGPHPDTLFSHVVAELGHPTEDAVKPVSVTTLADGVTIADFGKVIPARLSIQFRGGEGGRPITIVSGYELLENGRVNTASASRQGTIMNFTYTQKAGDQRYDTWDHLGLRYVEIPAIGGTFTVDDITGYIVVGEVAANRESTFQSSNAMLNSVYEMMRRSAIYSLQNQFVDTPTREKGQFLGDAINISAATMSTYFEREWTRKAILQFLASSDRYWNAAEGDKGRYNAVYPNGDGKRDIPDYSINMPFWVWSYYMQTGDRTLLEIAYPYLQQTAEYITKAIPATGNTAGLVTSLPGGSGQYQYGIIDWPADGRFGYDMNANARTVMNALSYRAFDSVSKIGKALGKSDAEIGDYAARAADLKDAMNTALISDGVYTDGKYTNGNLSTHPGQHSTSFPLAFGIAPEDQIPAMADYIAGMGMKQGPMTVDILLRGLFNAGRADAALDLLTNTEDYGWAQLLSQGYTFVFERWQYGESQSHGWGGAAAFDLLENFAGVRNTSPGAKTITIDPARGVLEHLSSTVYTERGPVSVTYSGEGKAYNLKINVPVNVEAKVVFPRIEGGQFVEVTGRNGPTVLTAEAQTVTVGSGIREYLFVDKSELLSLIEELEGEYEGNGDLYTTGTWAAYTAALDEAAALAVQDDATQAEVNAAGEALVEAATALKLRAAEIYVDLLGTLIDEASALTEADYKASSWTAMEEVLDQAKLIQAEPEAFTDEEVLEAISNLLSALQDLYSNPSANKQSLQTYIAMAKTLLQDAAKYIPAAVAKLTGELADAEAVNDDGDASQEAVDAASQALSDAINDMQTRGNKSALTVLIQLTQIYVKANYTETSWTAFEEAIASARTVLENDNAMQFQVDAASTAVQNAMKALVRKADFTALNAAIKAAQTIIDNVNDYVPSTIIGLPAELAAAKLVAENGNATQAQVNAATAALNGKILTARLKPDLSQLLSLTRKVEALNTAAYGDDSVKVLNAAIVSARSLVDSVNAGDAVTQKEVDDAYSGLLKAFSGLKASEKFAGTKAKETKKAKATATGASAGSSGTSAGTTAATTAAADSAGSGTAAATSGPARVSSPQASEGTQAPAQPQAPADKKAEATLSAGENGTAPAAETALTPQEKTAGAATESIPIAWILALIALFVVATASWLYYSKKKAQKKDAA